MIEGQLHTRASLAEDVRRLGVEPGDVVLVHAAVSKVGAVLGGPDALIGALLDVLGASGTLMAYSDWETLHPDLSDAEGKVRSEWREHVPGFDPLRSRSARDNGTLPEFIRTTPGALRSGNPGASMAALGHLAEWITADHPQSYGYGEGSPLAKLVEAGGRVLMIGAPWDTMTLVHHADHLAELPGKRVLRYEVPFASDTGTRWAWIEEFDTSEPVVDALPELYIEMIVSSFVEAGGGRQGKIGNAPSLFVEAPELLRHAVSWLESEAGSR